MVRPSTVVTALVAASASAARGYAPSRLRMSVPLPRGAASATVPPSSSSSSTSTSSRRGFVSKGVAFALGTVTAANVAGPPSAAHAVGPIKIDIKDPTYVAAPCPKDKPIPGEKAMKGMRGLCVQVKAELAENSPKDLDKVGVYGYVEDAVSSASVLANNPDAGTDAGQFTMIPSISTTDKKIEFEFIAAVPKEKDLSQYEDGIGPLNFRSLRVISYPGGQQYGAISPCEMNEFSQECEAWEEENGPYTKADFMVKSNPRTKGR